MQKCPVSGRTQMDGRSRPDMPRALHVPGSSLPTIPIGAHFTDGNTEPRRDEPTCSRLYSYSVVGQGVDSDGPTLSFMSCSLSVCHDGHRAATFHLQASPGSSPYRCHHEGHQALPAQPFPQHLLKKICVANCGSPRWGAVGQRVYTWSFCIYLRHFITQLRSRAYAQTTQRLNANL